MSAGLWAIQDEVTECRRCPRLVEWREQVAAEKAAYRDEQYWGRAVPGFGDPQAELVVIGLAPAAHGANRTGRMFTGDRSGDFLYAALHRCGLANQADSVSIDDGLELDGVWITAPVRCAPPANKPTTAERDNCRPFLDRELEELPGRTFLALGQFGYGVAAGILGIRPRPKFRHGVEAVAPGGQTLVGSFHVSQQNTFTGRLTEPMFDEVLTRAAELAGLPMKGSIVALALAAALIAGCGGDDDGDYSLATEQAFIDQCAESADRQACRCIYLRIVDEIPYERFVELDEQRAADPSFVPEEIERFALDCAFGLAE